MSKNEIEYNKCIDMLCATGKMPVTLYDALCQEASRQIKSAYVMSLEPTKVHRELEIFGERKSAKEDWQSAWFDYELTYADNFSMD